MWLEQADLAGRAMSKAQEVGGSVRVISRSDGGHDTSEVSTVLRDVDINRAASAEEIMESLSGFVQARLLQLCSFLFAEMLNGAKSIWERTQILADVVSTSIYLRMLSP